MDAERDLQAVSCHIPVLDGCRGLDALQKKAFGGPTLKNAVLFATYATLVSAATTKKQSRLDQLVAWCGGPSFDGCVIFDEAHRSEAARQSVVPTSRRPESSNPSVDVLRLGQTQ